MPTLTDKLEALGVTGVPLKIFVDSLSNWKQRVNLENHVDHESQRIHLTKTELKQENRFDLEAIIRKLTEKIDQLIYDTV